MRASIRGSFATGDFTAGHATSCDDVEARPDAVELSKQNATDETPTTIQEPNSKPRTTARNEWNMCIIPLQ
jgi:hypothetical protein